jgi:hypothetical protein
MNKNIIFIISLIIFLVSCGINNLKTKEAIIAKWKVKSIRTEQNKAKKDSLQTEEELKQDFKITFDIRKDGSYINQKGMHVDSGKWYLSNDEKILMFKSVLYSKDNLEFMIDKVERYQLVISSQDHLKKEILTLQIAND